MTDPRGIRNNNPGNIRRSSSNFWSGMAQEQTDPDFIQFISPEYGLRAIVRILRTYKRLGIKTLSDAISRWAPATENNTAAYVASVCAECEIGPNDEVDLDQVMPDVVRAIVWQENGCCPYTDEQINKGISLA